MSINVIHRLLKRISFCFQNESVDRNACEIRKKKLRGVFLLVLIFDVWMQWAAGCSSQVAREMAAAQIVFLSDPLMITVQLHGEAGPAGKQVNWPHNSLLSTSSIKQLQVPTVID
jgi:hypothetical protein